MQNNPRVSVVMTTFNRASLVTAAMASVVAQSYRHLELLVVDDGSTDDTGEVVKEFIASQADTQLRIHYIRQINRGPASARNRGMKESSGDYVMFMDDDDLLDPAAIEELAAVLKGAREAAVAYGSHVCVDAAAKPVSEVVEAPGRLSQYELVSAIIRGSWFVPVHGYLFNRQALESIGPWDLELSSQEDDEFALRAALRGVCFLPAKSALVLYRDHEGVRRSRPGLPGKPDKEGLLSRLEADLSIREQTYRLLRARRHLHHFAAAFSGWYERLVSRYSPLLERPEYAGNPVIRWARAQAAAAHAPLGSAANRLPTAHAVARSAIQRARELEM